MKVIPVRDHLYISVKRPTQETKTQSGIILKNQVVQNQTIAEIIGIGEGRILEDGTIMPSGFQVGDKIIFYDYAGVVIRPEDGEPDKDYLIIKSNDVIAILK